MKSSKKLPDKEKHRHPLPKDVEYCICYEALPKDVHAYFSSFIYPAVDEKEEDRYEVSVQTRDGEYTLLHTEPIKKRTLSKTYERRIARVILLHYCGGHQLLRLEYLAKKLVEWKGHSMRRNTIHEIHEFLYLYGPNNKKGKKHE